VTLLGHHLSRLDDAGDWSRHVQAELPWVRSEVEQASALDTLGALALLQGRHEEALALCQRALALWEQVLGPGHPRVAEALDRLGAVLRAQGKHCEATELHGRSLAILGLTLGAGHPFVALAEEEAWRRASAALVSATPVPCSLTK
jgi:tetratricopeptide (TPR) repeat protein